MFPWLTGVGAWLLAAALQVSGYQNTPLSIILAALGVLCFIQAVRQQGVSFRLNPFRPTIIIMAEACHIVYEQARHAGLHIFVSIIDGSRDLDRGNADPEDQQLSMIAMYIAHTNAPILGKKPPSRTLEELPKSIKNRMRFASFASELWLHGSKVPEYVSISMRKRDVLKALKEIATWDAGAHRNIVTKQALKIVRDVPDRRGWKA
jgi:hypothetical protein